MTGQGAGRSHKSYLRAGGNALQLAEKSPVGLAYQKDREVIDPSAYLLSLVENARQERALQSRGERQNEKQWPEAEASLIQIRNKAPMFTREVSDQRSKRPSEVGGPHLLIRTGGLSERCFSQIQLIRLNTRVTG